MLLPHCCHFIENFILTKVIKIYIKNKVYVQKSMTDLAIGQQLLTVISFPRHLHVRRGYTECDYNLCTIQWSTMRSDRLISVFLS